MSATDAIRKVLAKAPGPMSYSDIRHQLPDSIPGQNISAALFAMAKAGEVIKDRAAEGAGYTYLIDSSAKPTRASKRVPPPASASSESESPAPGRKKRKARAAADATPKPRKAARRTVAKAFAVAAADEAPLAPVHDDCTIPCSIVRLLCGALLKRGRKLEADERTAMLIALDVAA